MKKKLFKLYLIFFLSTAFGGNSVHIIGDSHTRTFSRIPYCKIDWLGPVTLHRVGRDGLDIVDFRKLKIKDGDVVVFTFGEIDTRCHIGRQILDHKRKLHEVTELLAKKYIQTILANCKNYSNILPIVYLPTPPGNKQKEVPNYRFPFIGTNQQRVLWAKTLNKDLLKQCRKFKIPCINTYHIYSTPDGLLKRNLTDGHIHIHPRHAQPIKNRLDQIILNHGYKIKNDYIISGNEKE
ncbi:hypothetical protein COB11_03965 [Candidatus Aerophobetes bacterium]|uniref:SGNH hydrolase-type esterase domain-containing protein n=1 Tax=Aerophobetes bacterium TaxID=2030807 RepID=A0A2A4YI46_UNCAE|nr:MAG: hypothetical protein COB11_03965 [Candidatus Aerophobetes bacterium]